MMSDDGLTESQESDEDRAIDAAIVLAVREALDRHARLGESVAIWLDGRMQVVPAAVALRLHDEEAERRGRPQPR